MSIKEKLKNNIRSLVNTVEELEKQSWIASKMNKKYFLFLGSRKDKKNTKAIRKAIKILKTINLC